VPGSLVGEAEASLTKERPMTSPDVAPTAAVPAPAAASAPAPVGSPVPARVALPASRIWLRVALFLAAGAQLITISALVRAQPLAVTWSTLLLAIAPAPVTAAATFAPARAARPAAVVAAVVLLAGIVGGVLHTGLFFLPALAALAIGAGLLWRE
jgi:hypothetical protein